MVSHHLDTLIHLGMNNNIIDTDVCEYLAVRKNVVHRTQKRAQRNAYSELHYAEFIASEIRLESRPRFI